MFKFYFWPWKGTDKVEFIKFDMHNNNEVEWGGNAFEKMKSLRVLIMENAASCTGPKDLPNSLRVLDWRYYPSPSLPSDFNPKQLVILNMSKSCLKLFQPPKACSSFAVFHFNMNLDLRVDDILNQFLLFCRCWNPCLQ